jgi:hypothetical protein
MDLTRQNLQMAKKKQKAKKSQPARSRSPLLSAMIGTVFNMTATIATFGSVLLYLIAAKHST